MPAYVPGCEADVSDEDFLSPTAGAADDDDADERDKEDECLAIPPPTPPLPLLPLLLPVAVAVTADDVVDEVMEEEPEGVDPRRGASIV